MQICKNFVYNYSIAGVVLVLSFVVILAGIAIWRIKNGHGVGPAVPTPLIKITLLIYIPPCLQILCLQNHSAIHEFSLMKFALPFIFTVFLIVFAVLYMFDCWNMHLFVNYENNGKYSSIKISVLYSATILLSVMLLAIVNLLQIHNHYYPNRIGAPENFEVEHLIRDNYRYEDVLFSFTRAIEANPPNNLAISNKLIYKINEISDINKFFPHLAKNARILLVAYKGDYDKDDEIIKKETHLINGSEPVFESENYAVYDITIFL